MRVAIVHDENSTIGYAPCLLESLQRIFPQPTDRVDDVDLVLSTSRSAAHNVDILPGRLHLCYLTQSQEQNSTLKISTSPQRQITSGTLRIAAGGESAFSLSYQRPIRTAQALSLGVTHYLAGSGSIAAGLKTEIGQPVKVISPPVETRDFRPDRRKRSDYYLTVAQPGEDQTLQLAAEATQSAGRRLVVIVDEPLKMTSLWRGGAHVQFVSAATADELRDYLCECRAFLCLREADFDADVIRAQACGTPVIVSSRCGISELVIDAEQDGPGTGLFFDEPTVESLVSALRELERRPQKLSATLAWAQATQFSVSRFEREITDFVNNLLAISASALREYSQQTYPGIDVNRPAA